MGSADGVVLELERKVSKAVTLLDAVVRRNAEFEAERRELLAELERLRGAQERIEGVRERLERAERKNRQLRKTRDEALERARMIVRKLGLLDEELGLKGP